MLCVFLLCFVVCEPTNKSAKHVEVVVVVFKKELFFVSERGVDSLTVTVD